jgi:hypothetical protein
MKSSRFKRRASLLVALAVASSPMLLSSVPASACGAGGGFFDYVTPNTLHVVIKPFHKRYARGDTVTVKVVVTRPAAEDPAGFGVPIERPVTQPASDVNVGIGINVGRAFLPGYGETNDKGEVAVGIKLGRRVPAGNATVRAYAYKERLNTPCVVVEEQGYRTSPKAFRVTSTSTRESN